MLPTKDQLRLKAHSKAKKNALAIPLKMLAETVGTLGFIPLPFAFFNPAFLVALPFTLPLALFVRWQLLIKAGSVYGPYLGDDPGRARKATLDDARRGRLT